MINVDLIKAASQSLTITINEVLWELTVKAARTMMIADIVRDGRVLVQGQRIVAGGLIIPFKHLSMQGNFAILTPDDEIPWWEQFGDTHQMVYLSPEEIGL